VTAAAHPGTSSRRKLPYYVLQTHRSQNTAAVADAPGIPGQHAGALVAKAAFGAARQGPLSAAVPATKKPGSPNTAADKTREGIGSIVEGIHPEKTVNLAFSAVKAIRAKRLACARPVSAKDPV